MLFTFCGNRVTAEILAISVCYVFTDVLSIMIKGIHACSYLSLLCMENKDMLLWQAGNNFYHLYSQCKLVQDLKEMYSFHCI